MASTSNRIDFTIGFNVDKTGLNELQQSLKQVSTQANFTNYIGAGTDELTKAGEAAKILNDALSVSWNTKLNQLDLSKFESQLANSGKTVTELSNDLLGAGTTGTQAFNKMSSAILSTNLELRDSNKFLNSMAETLVKTAKWTVASSAIRKMTGAIQEAWGFAKDLDSSLNDIRIVTNKSAEEMADFAVQANNAAKALGASTTDYTNASLIFYQQGLSDKEVEARTDVVLKVANVTGQAASEVADNLTSVWNGYQVTADQAEASIDILAAVAANTASNLEELSTGMSKVAAAANEMGVGEAQLASQISTIVSATRQAPETVGQALKTVFARMSTINAGGEDEDDGATLTSYSAKMNKFGINVLDATGHLRDMGDVIEEIGGKWDTFSRETQISLAQAMAGTRQYVNVMALFENWDQYEKTLNIANDSLGTLQTQQDTYMESTAAHLAQLSASMETIYNSLFDMSTINKFIDALTKVVNMIGNMVESLGGGMQSFAMIGTIVANIFSNQIGRGIESALEKSKQLEANQRAIALVEQQTNAQMGQASVEGAGSAEVEAYKQQGERQKELLDIKQKISTEDYNRLTNLNKEITDMSVLKAQIEEIGTDEEAWDAAQADLNNEIDKYQGYLDTISGYNKDTQIEYQEQIAIWEEEIEFCQKNIELEEKEKQELDNKNDSMLNGLSIMRDMNQLTGQLTGEIRKQEDALEDQVVRVSEIPGEIAESTEKVQENKKAIEETTAKANETRLSYESIADILQHMPEEYQKSETFTDLIGKNTEETLKNLQEANLTEEEYAKILQRIQTILPQLQNNDRARLDLIDKLNKKQIQYNQLLAEQNYKLNEFNEQIYAQLRQDVFSEMTKSLTGIVTLSQQASNLIKTLTNPDLTTWEKLSKTISSLAIVVPMAVRSFKGLQQLMPDLNALLQIHQKRQQAIAVAETESAVAAKGFGKAAKTAGDEASAGFLKATQAVLTFETALGPVYIILAAVAAALATVTAIVISARNYMQRYDTAIEKVTNSSEELAEASNDVAQSLEDLKDVIDTYDDAKEALDECTKGTEEWYNALQDTNDAAKELLNTIKDLDYAGLSGEDIRNAYNTSTGEFDQNVIDTILNQQQQNSSTTELASAYGDYQKTLTEISKDMYDVFNDALKFASDDYFVENTMPYLDEFIGASTEESRALLQELYPLLDLTEEEFDDLADSIVNLANKADAASATLESIIDIDLLPYLPEDYGTAEADIVKQMVNNNTEQYAKALEKLFKEQNLSDEEKALLQQIDGDLNTGFSKASTSISKASAADNKIYNEMAAALSSLGYTEVSGQKAVKGNDNNREFTFRDSSGEEQTYSAATWAAMIASAAALEQVGIEADEVAEAFKNLNKNTGEYNDAIYSFIESGNLEQISENQYKALVDWLNDQEDINIDFANLDEESLTAGLTNLFAGFLGLENPEDVSQYIDISGFIDSLKNFNTMLEDVGQHTRLAAQEVFSGLDLSNATIAVQREIADNLGTVFTYGGQQALNSTSKIYEQLADMGDDAVNDFTDVFDSITWGSVTTKSFIKAMEDAGLSTDGLEDDISVLVDTMNSAANAARNFSDWINELYANLHDIIDGLSTEDTIDQDTYDELNGYLAELGLSINDFFDPMLGGMYRLTADATKFQEIVQGSLLDAVQNEINTLENNYNLLSNLDVSQLNHDLDIPIIYNQAQIDFLYDTIINSFTKGVKEIPNALLSSDTRRAQNLAGENYENYTVNPVFGNVDLNAEARISGFTWDEEALNQAQSGLLTLESDNNPIDIAFSPLLETDDGLVILNDDTVTKYINGLIDKANEEGLDPVEYLLDLDAEGLEVEGVYINNILADVGETAADTAEMMKYFGVTGKLALDEQEVALKEMSDELVDWYNGLEDNADKSIVRFILRADIDTSDWNLNEWQEAVDNQINITALQEEIDLLGTLGVVSKDTIGEWQDALIEGNIDQYLEDINDAIESLVENEDSYLNDYTNQIREYYTEVAETATSFEELNKSFKDSIYEDSIAMAAYNDRAIELSEAMRIENLDTDELQDYAKYLQKIASSSDMLADSLEDDDDAARSLATQIMRMNNGVQELADNFDEWADYLQNSTRESQEYYEALIGMEGAFEDLLDISTDFLDAEKLIIENMEDLQLAAQGDEEAIDRLRQAAYEEILLELGIDDQALIEGFNLTLADIQAFLDENILEITASIGEIEGSQEYIDALNQLIDDTALTTDEVTEMLRQMGYDVTFDPETVEVEYRYPQTRKLHEVTMIEQDEDTGAYSWIESETVLNDGDYVDDAYISGVGVEVDTGDGESSGGKTNVNQVQVAHVSNITKRASGSVNNYSSSNKGGNTTSSSSSGSSSSEKEAKQEDYLEDQADRYHDINLRLQDISTTLNRIQRQEEKLFGKDLIDNLNKQLATLDDQIDATRIKLDIALDEAQEYRDELATFGVEFDEYGMISNYFAVMDAQLAYVTEIIDKYNAMSAEEQEAYEDTLKAAEDAYKDFVDKLNDYDTLIHQTIPDLEDDIVDALDQEIQIQITKFTMEAEIRLDMKEAENDWNEFYRKIILGYSDDSLTGQGIEDYLNYQSLYNQNDSGRGSIQALTDQVNDTLEQLQQYDQYGWSSVYGDDYNQALSDLKTYYTELMNELEEAQDLIEDVWNTYLDSIDEVIDAFDDHLDQYEFLADELEHDMNLIELLYGEEAYAEMETYYQKIYDNDINRLDTLSKMVDYYQLMMDAATDDEEYKKWRDAWEDAISEMNDVWEQAVQDAVDILDNAINKIIDDFNKSVTNGLGLDFLGEQWDLLNDEADIYLNKVDAIYQVSDLKQKYLDAIDATDSISAQQKLNDLMQEQIDYLTTKENLTQYDIDRAELEYEIMLKQIALEEAQQNKSTMRLRRDSQGNYTYQYVSDEDEIAAAQDELLALQSQLYDLDLNNYKENLNNLYNYYAEFQEELYDLYTQYYVDHAITEEEYEAKRAEIVERYESIIQDYVIETNVARENLEEDMFKYLAMLYANDADVFNAMLTEEEKAFLDFGDSTGKTAQELYEDAKAKIEQLTEDEKNAIFQEMIPYADSGIADLAELLDNFIEDEGKDIEEFFANEMAEMDEASNNFVDNIKTIEDVSGVAVADLVAGEDKVADAMENVIEKSGELVESRVEEMEVIQDLYDELLDLADAYDTARQAAIDAAQAARDYWMQAQEIAAEAAAANKYSDSTVSSIYDDLSGNDTEGTGSGTSSSGSGDSTGSTQGNGNVDIGDKVQYVSGQYYYDSYGTKPLGSKYLGSTVYVTNKVSDSRAKPVHISTGSSLGNGDLGWLTKDQLEGYKTGGYTGEWQDGDDKGKLAVLHQKELVLNSKDTENLLSAIGIIRDVSQLLNNINGNLFNKMNHMMANTGNQVEYDTGKDLLEQDVHIEATFPNVTNSHEIEDALNNLVNIASQHANKAKVRR